MRQAKSQKNDILEFSFQTEFQAYPNRYSFFPVLPLYPSPSNLISTINVAIIIAIVKIMKNIASPSPFFSKIFIEIRLCKIPKTKDKITKENISFQAPSRYPPELAIDDQSPPWYLP